MRDHVCVTLAIPKWWDLPFAAIASAYLDVAGSLFAYTRDEIHVRDLGRRVVGSVGCGLELDLS